MCKPYEVGLLVVS